MAPHSMESILQPPHWPVALSNFVTWCLMWDPKCRPTSMQALNHEYFSDAVDPLRPKSSTSRLLGRKQSDKSFKSVTTNNTADSPNLSTKSSWLRRSFIGGRESPAPIAGQNEGSRPVVNVSHPTNVQPTKVKASANKRATWANGAPMPILPSIRPVSPLSNAVTAQANSRVSHANENNSTNQTDGGKSSKKIGRQLSVNSNGNHYADLHRQEAERALNGGNGVTSPSNGQKESFFSHLRKRARRLSGRNQGAYGDDVEANAGCVPWSNRSSIALDSSHANQSGSNKDFADLDKALQNVRYSLDLSPSSNPPSKISSPSLGSTPSKRQPVPSNAVRAADTTNMNTGPVSSRTRRALQLSTHPVNRYETPEEEDELLHEVLQSTTKAARKLGQRSITMDDATRAAIYKNNCKSQSIRPVDPTSPVSNPYPTPSPSAKRNNVSFMPDASTSTPSKPMRVHNPCRNSKDDITRQWPTPPYDDNQWANSATASIYAASSTYR